MRILGIDQSLRETGWFFLDTATNAEAQGVIKPDSELEPIDRLDVLDTRLRWLIDEQRPDVIAIEDYGYCGPGRARELGELGGILRIILRRAEIKTWVIGVGTLKKFVTGKGSGDKDVMLLYTFKNFGVEFRNHNISDAFGLCMMACVMEHQTNSHLPERFTKPQNEALTVPRTLFKSVALTARSRKRGE